MRKFWMGAGLISAAAFALIGVAQVVTPGGRLESWDEIQPRNVREGISIRSVAGDTVSFTRIELDAGAETPDHNHADEQFIYLESGRASGYVGTIEYILEPGDIIVIPSWVPHGFQMLEDTVWYEVHGPG